MQTEFWKNFMLSPELQHKHDLSSDNQQSPSLQILQKISNRLTYDTQQDTSLRNLEMPGKTSPQDKPQLLSSLRREGSLDHVAVTNSGKKNGDPHLKAKKSTVFLNCSNKKSLQQSKRLASMDESVMGRWLGVQSKKQKDSPFTKQIFKSQVNQNENFFYELSVTLRQLRDISKENLNTNLKMLSLLERQKSSTQKGERKSMKREKSTVKKQWRYMVLEQKISKFSQKLRECTRFKHDLEMYVKGRPSGSKHTKPASAFR